MSDQRRLTVCYFGTYRDTYSRNVNMIEGLRLAGVVVLECHHTLWKGIEDRVAATAGGWLRPRFWMRVLGAYLKLIGQYRKISEYDILIVGYPGQFDVFLAWLLARIAGKPLIWDVFMSIVLIAEERGLEQRSRFTVRLLKFFEGFALRLPDLLIQDTQEYAAWLAERYRVALSKFRLVPTGADDRYFQPRDGTPKPADGVEEQHSLFRVIYYGTFIPNHGLATIVGAAKLLKDQHQIRFELIGTGPDRALAEKLVEQFSLTNVHFTDWLEKPRLVERIRQADVCLGAFGNTPQSLMTIQNKIFEGMALGMAVLSGDSPAARRVFRHTEQIYLCPRTAEGLAAGINVLRGDSALRLRLVRNGLSLFRDRYNLKRIGEVFASHLASLGK